MLTFRECKYHVEGLVIAIRTSLSLHPINIHLPRLLTKGGEHKVSVYWYRKPNYPARKQPFGKFRERERESFEKTRPPTIKRQIESKGRFLRRNFTPFRGTWSCWLILTSFRTHFVGPNSKLLNLLWIWHSIEPFWGCTRWPKSTG